MKVRRRKLRKRVRKSELEFEVDLHHFKDLSEYGRVHLRLKIGIKPLVDRVYSLEKSIDAYLYLAAGRAKGKLS